jgi:A/G-specific adenine glycosylase
MLQQTRVAAVIPYYESFLRSFPDLETLAGAAEADLLACWSGLGYYSRARNLQKAARQANGIFPRDYSAIRGLAGIGDYTAAAISSIAFGLPHAALDGNVMRVIARITNDSSDISSVVTRRRFQMNAEALLDRRSPGEFNQAMMELGATICLPRNPQCDRCPVAGLCQARVSGTVDRLPVRSAKIRQVRVKRTLLVIVRGRKLLMWLRPANSSRLAGFWELPEPEHLAAAKIGIQLGTFRHSITRHNFTFEIRRAEIDRKPTNFSWISLDQWDRLPVSTTARKALRFSGAHYFTGVN